jgi:hypothetical protein
MHVIAVAALLFALAPEHIAQVKAYAGHHSWDKVAGAESFWDTALVKDALRVQTACPREAYGRWRLDSRRG